MLRQTLKFSRSIFSAGKFQNNVFNRSSVVGSNVLSQHQLYPTQYRSETTDLAMALHFPIQPEKVKALINTIDKLGGHIDEKRLVDEVYYDSVPSEESIVAETELGSGRADIITPKEQEARRLKGTDAERAKPATRIKTPKKDNVSLYVLTKRDMWLVRQNGNWILKVPAVDESGRTHLELDPARRIPIFREAEGERAIRRELSLQQDETSEARTGVPLPSLEEDLASRMGVVPYAAFRTTQYEMVVPTPSSEEDFEVGKPDSKDTVTKSDEELSETDSAAVSSTSGDEELKDMENEMNHVEDISMGHVLRLDIEETDFGYAMGRLSLTIENPDEEAITEKMDTIASVLAALDVKLVDRTNTTILEYLERQRPGHFKQLVAASVAKDHSEKAPKKAEEKEE